MSTVEFRVPSGRILPFMKINNSILELVQGDITAQDVDAIVNAANSGLAAGAGVCGAIYRAGGDTIFDEAEKLAPCPPGEARITSGGKLAARWVIHAVGPIYNRVSGAQNETLASAYRSSLELAAKHSLKSIAFPSLSTGIYGYPLSEAAPTAINEIARFLRDETHAIELVRFVLFDGKTFEAFADARRALK